MDYNGVLVGLGSPGSRYEGTRHNYGFAVVDALVDFAQRHGAAESLNGGKFSCELWRIRLKELGGVWLAAKPQTFMNASGEAVGPIMRYYKIDPADVYCVYDDMDLPVGKLRIRPNGSAGGHNDIKSLIAHMGTSEFPHFRVGIGRPLPQWTVVDHVLAPFPDEVQTKVADGIRDMAEAVLGTLRVGIDRGMNLYNPKKGHRPR